jgi:hypothetical protein
VLFVLLTEDDSVGSKALGAVRQLPTVVRLSEREGVRMVHALARECVGSRGYMVQGMAVAAQSLR